MKTYEPDKPLVLIGQPHGNFSFFRDVMGQLFGKQFLDLSERPDAPMLSWTNGENRPDGRWLPKIECVAGMFDSSKGNSVEHCCPAGSQYLLLVADPFAAAVESYEQAKLDSDAGRFWRSGKPAHIDQYCCSIDEYLDLFPRSLYDHLPQNLTLENYQQRLNKSFVYVGPAEDFQMSAQKIADAVGRTLDPVPPLPIPKETRTMPENLRSRFEHNFPLINQIYQFAGKCADSA